MSIFKSLKDLIKIKGNRGMTYVELIVVLSIFSIMTSIALFNYNTFQSRVDIRNLSSDIAIKASEAQKASLSGKLPLLSQKQPATPSTWKPSYGVYFDKSVATNKSFIYFDDLDQTGTLDSPTCAANTECLEKILITKGSYISNLDAFYQSPPGGSLALTTLSLAFVRPSVSPIINSTPVTVSPISYVQISISSSNGSATSLIKVYPSGRIQVN